MTLAQLATLESAGLVALNSAQPELEYVFRHTLIQESIYSSLTRQDRRQLHHLVGDALEEIYPNRMDELAWILAGHYLEAGEQAHALTYFLRAGKVAQRGYANAEAELHFRQALEIIQTQPVEIDEEQLRDLYLSLGRVFELTGQYSQALANYEAMEQAGLARKNDRLVLESLLARVTIHSTPTLVFNAEQADLLSNQALNLARRLGDHPAEAKTYWNQMLQGYFSGRIQDGREAGLRGLKIARDLNLRQQLGYILNDLGSYIYTTSGELEESYAALTEARQIWDEIGEIPMVSDSLTNLAVIHLIRGNFESALQATRESYQTAESIHNLWGMSYSRSISGTIYTQLGQFGQALQHLEEGLHTGRQVGFAAVESINLSVEVLIYSIIGDLDLALQKAREAVAHSESSAFFLRPHSLASLALVSVKRGDLATAQDRLELAAVLREETELLLFSPLIPTAKCELFLTRKDYQALLDYTTRYIGFLRAHDALGFLSNGLYYRGLALWGLKRLDEAVASLTDARELAQKQGFLFDKWQVLSALAKLEAERGRPEAAQARWREARLAVEHFAAALESQELKEKFLSLPEIARIGEKV